MHPKTLTSTSPINDHTTLINNSSKLSQEFHQTCYVHKNNPTKTKPLKPNINLNDQTTLKGHTKTHSGISSNTLYA